MSENIKVFRTPMGDLIATQVSLVDGLYTLNDVLSLQFNQVKNEVTGEMAVDVGFGSIAAFSRDATAENPSINIEMAQEHAMFVYKPTDELIEGYSVVVKGRKIVKPSNKIVVGK